MYDQAELVYDAQPNRAGDVPLVRATVVDGEADVDAVFRATRIAQGILLNVTFARRSPLAPVGPNTFLPLGAKSAFYEYDAFWALALPTCLPPGVADIWRGYWAQRAMREMPRRAYGVTVTMHAAVV